MFYSPPPLSRTPQSLLFSAEFHEKALTWCWGMAKIKLIDRHAEISNGHYNKLQIHYGHGLSGCLFYGQRLNFLFPEHRTVCFHEISSLGLSKIFRRERAGILSGAHPFHLCESAGTRASSLSEKLAERKLCDSPGVYSYGPEHTRLRGWGLFD